MKQGTSLAGMKDATGLSYRGLSEKTGLTLIRVYRAVNEIGHAHAGDATILRQAMQDLLRREHSSDPDFLRRIQEIAVPFLASRLRQAAPLARSAIRLVEEMP